jgi:hypothetical protein
MSMIDRQVDFYEYGHSINKFEIEEERDCIESTYIKKYKQPFSNNGPGQRMSQTKIVGIKALRNRRTLGKKEGRGR